MEGENKYENIKIKREGVEEKEARGGTREMEGADKNEERGKQRVLRSKKRGAREGAREKREREREETERRESRGRTMERREKHIWARASTGTAGGGEKAEQKKTTERRGGGESDERVEFLQIPIIAPLCVSNLFGLLGLQVSGYCQIVRASLWRKPLTNQHEVGTQKLQSLDSAFCSSAACLFKASFLSPAVWSRCASVSRC